MQPRLVAKPVRIPYRSNRDLIQSFCERLFYRISLVVASAVAACPVNVANAAATSETGSGLSANNWMYVITIVVVVLLVGAALVVFLRRRTSPSIIAAATSLQTDVPQQQDSSAVQRARIEELAAISGMLGELLDQYLSSRFYHLLLIYPDAISLRRRLGEVEGEYAAVSFYYFSKLISLLAECESQCGAMPLLSSQVAHDAAQRLINRFLSSIPQGEEEGSIDTFEIAAKFTEHRLKFKNNETQSGTAVSQVGDFVRRVDPKRYVSEGTSEEKVQELLVKEFAAYEKWLKLAPPGLILGAEALRAFYKLVSHELRGVGDQRRRISSSTRLDIADSLALEVLSDKLTPLAVKEILSESPLPRPIGVFLRKAPPQKLAYLMQQAPQQQTTIPLTPEQFGELLRRAGTPTVAQMQIGTQIIQQQGKGPEK